MSGARVYLKASGERKIAVIKVIREATGLSLRSAKAIADGGGWLPGDSWSFSTREAEQIAKELRLRGATCEIVADDAKITEDAAASEPAEKRQPSPQALVAASIWAGFTNLGLAVVHASGMTDATRWTFYPPDTHETIRRLALKLDGEDA